MSPRPALPLREGVGASRVGLPAGPWPTVLDFLEHRFAAIPRAQWLQRLNGGDVFDAGGQPIGAAHPYPGSGHLYYYRQLDHEPAVPFEEQVLFQDDHLVVADKPHFLAVAPAGRHLHETLLVRLKKRLGLDTLVPLHRLDRETAGVMLFTVQPAERNRYLALFRKRAVHKVYEAVAPAPTKLALPLALPLVRRSRIEVGPEFFRQQEVAGEPNAETRIECIGSVGALAHYRLTPTTGQQHQLRVHMAALGLPIVNDLFYPVVVNGPNGADDFSRPLQLLARSIAFTDPVTGEARRFESRRALALALAATHDECTTTPMRTSHQDKA